MVAPERSVPMSKWTEILETLTDSARLLRPRKPRAPEPPCTPRPPRDPEPVRPPDGGCSTGPNPDLGRRSKRRK